MVRFFVLALFITQNLAFTWANEGVVGKEWATALSGNSERGFPYEYDPGPAPGSKWEQLFASTPNYRALGLTVLGGKKEKFRWTFGPMFYRGRLTPNSVKVLVIGQEGAQDESLSNRSFTGGTGARMQNFLKHLGIDRSYLFLNTFVYTINGQYSEQEGPNKGKTPPALFWLAQNPKSPVVMHRHQILDYVFETNKQSIALVIAVGTAAKDTVKTYLASKGGSCPRIDEGCDADVLGKMVKVIGVRHPGGASPNNGGAAALAGIERDFKNAAQRIAQWQLETIFISVNRREWLPADRPGRELKVVNRKAAFLPEYVYSETPVPFADFSFGTTWRLGRGGTSSNRKDRQQSIQLFSEQGCYNAFCERLADGTIVPTDRSEIEAGYSVPLDYKTTRPTDLMTKIDNLPASEIPWEAPRSSQYGFDSGPGAEMARLLLGYLPGSSKSRLVSFFEEYARLGGSQDSSYGLNGMYRGRFEAPKLLVIADQESNDDLFSTRALTGTGGQRFQRFLDSTSVSGNYLILRTLPLDTSDLADSAKERLVMEPGLVQTRSALVREILKKGSVRAVVSLGNNARIAVEGLVREGILKIGQQSLPVVALNADAQDGSWNTGLGELARLGIARRGAQYDGSLSVIPRNDLPFQTKWWLGTSGTRSARPVNRDSGKLDGNYYKLYMPQWVARLKPVALSPAEAQAIKNAPKPDTSTSGMGSEE